MLSSFAYSNLINVFELFAAICKPGARHHSFGFLRLDELSVPFFVFFFNSIKRKRVSSLMKRCVSDNLQEFVVFVALNPTADLGLGDPKSQFM